MTREEFKKDYSKWRLAIREGKGLRVDIDPLLKEKPKFVDMKFGDLPPVSWAIHSYMMFTRHFKKWGR